jgi:hypothetical protein
MTKLLNIALSSQDFYHVMILVLRSCSHAVLQFCSFAVTGRPDRVQRTCQSRLESPAVFQSIAFGVGYSVFPDGSGQALCDII